MEHMENWRGRAVCLLLAFPSFRTKDQTRSPPPLFLSLSLKLSLLLFVLRDSSSLVLRTGRLWWSGFSGHHHETIGGFRRGKEPNFDHGAASRTPQLQTRLPVAASTFLSHRSSVISSLPTSLSRPSFLYNTIQSSTPRYLVNVYVSLTRTLLSAHHSVSVSVSVSRCPGKSKKDNVVFVLVFAQIRRRRKINGCGS